MQADLQNYKTQYGIQCQKLEESRKEFETLNEQFRITKVERDQLAWSLNVWYSILASLFPMLLYSTTCFLEFENYQYYTRIHIRYTSIIYCIHQAVTAELAHVREELTRRIEILDRTARELGEERFLVTAHSRFETRFENDSRQVSARFSHLNSEY